MLTSQDVGDKATFSFIGMLSSPGIRPTDWLLSQHHRNAELRGRNVRRTASSSALLLGYCLARVGCRNREIPSWKFQSDMDSNLCDPTAGLSQAGVLD